MLSPIMTNGVLDLVISISNHLVIDVYSINIVLNHFYLCVIVIGRSIFFILCLSENAIKLCKKLRKLMRNNDVTFNYITYVLSVGQ